jgi:hypothetical protein
MSVRSVLGTVLVVAIARWPNPGTAWNNGQTGNTTTNAASECAHLPYATHDWIADRALALLPAAARARLEPHKAIYLLGT